MKFPLFVRRYALLSLLACLLVASTTAHAQEAAETVAGEVLVGVRAANETAFQANSADIPVGRVTGYQPHLHAYRLKLNAGVSLKAALAQLRKRGDVVYAEPNHILRAAATPNEGYYAAFQWSLPKIQADAAWSLWRPQASVTIAVIDTGIDSTHPDLKNKMLRDGQGNVVGYNSITGKADVALDDDWHGTHCAGIAAAQIDHGGGVSGIAGWNGQAGSSDTSFTKLMPVKALDSNEQGTDATVSDGIVWAADHGAKVISLSLAGGGSSALINAVRYAWEKGCVLVAAAGNFGSATPTFPASCDNVISVAATDWSDGLASFSSYGNWVSVAAPGVNIISTTPTYATHSGFPLNYGLGTGTSMATPHVAGEAALIWAQNPALTNAQVVSLIESNVDPYTPSQGDGIAPNAGRINVLRALQGAGGAPAPPPTPPPSLPVLPSATASATFVQADAETGGSWKGVYGGQGYDIIADSTSLPPGILFNDLGAATWTWTGSIPDGRALQKSGSLDHVAACWYGADFTEDLNFTDGVPHQVALYLLDWDNDGRKERVTILDAGTGNVLDSQKASKFSGGTYLVWNIQGHVRIEVTAQGGENAVLSGIFFDSIGNIPASPAPVSGVTAAGGNGLVVLNWKNDPAAASYDVKRSANTGGPYAAVASNVSATTYTDSAVANGTAYYYVVTAVNAAGESVNSNEASATPQAAVIVSTGNVATFVKSDSRTQGAWQTTYGSNGYSIVADQYRLPGSLKFTASGNNTWTWSGSTKDKRALKKATRKNDNIAATFYGGAFTIDWNQTDSKTHQVALYCLDWDNGGRTQKIDVVDPTTNTVLDSQTISSFSDGQYLVWQVTGHVIFRITDQSGSNAVVSGFFVD